MSYKLAIDPGKTTGIAIRDNEGPYRTGVILTDKEVWDLIQPGCEVVIYEAFQAAVIDKNGLLTVRIVGGIQATAHRLGIPTVRHMPQFRYRFLDDSRAILKEIGLRTTGDHELDALAHLLAFEETGK